jgi:hypothetical protein
MFEYLKYDDIQRLYKERNNPAFGLMLSVVIVNQTAKNHI